jgi:23S rRNA (adenine2503-C2)-methyltransferase
MTTPTASEMALFETALAPGERQSKKNLIGLTLADFEALVSELGESKFRARQLHSWVYVHTVRDVEAMTNLSKPLRDKLAQQYRIGSLALANKQVSSDGTQKYLFQLDDGQKVESVLMPFEDSYAVCLSTQVGCAVNCDFCATGKIGFKRQLRADEIVEQLLFIRHDSGLDVRNIVLMGQGEPLLNYDEVLKAIRLINTSAEIGMRHITLSTSGIIPAIDRLAEEGLQLNLAVSLHAPNNEVRNRFMPINRKYPLEKLLPCLKSYVAKTGRRITIEYILLNGINDSIELASELNAQLKDIKCLINLIPYNPIGEQYGYERPSRNRVEAFRRELKKGRHTVTVRLERGADIAAACGQLHNLEG